MNLLSPSNYDLYRPKKSSSDQLKCALLYFNKYHGDFYTLNENDIDGNLFTEFVTNLLRESLSYNTVDKYVTAIKSEICFRFRSKQAQVMMTKTSNR